MKKRTEINIYSEECPNCNIKLTENNCDLCGWVKVKSCEYKIEKVCPSYCTDEDKKKCERYINLKGK